MLAIDMVVDTFVMEASFEFAYNLLDMIDQYKVEGTLEVPL
jgi:hypothetical protein